MGQSHGFRLLERTQNEENKNIFPLLAVDCTPLSFAFDNFKFFGKVCRHTRHKFKTILRDGSVENTEVKWHY